MMVGRVFTKGNNGHLAMIFSGGHGGECSGGLEAQGKKEEGEERLKRAMPMFTTPVFTRIATGDALYERCATFWATRLS